MIFILLLVFCLICYGISGIITSIFGGDIMLIFYIMMPVLIVVSILIVYIYESVAKEPFTYFIEDHPTIKNSAYAIFAILALIGIIFVFVDANNPSQEQIENEQKYNDCYSNSTAFYKCSWSTLENRCVCKQR